jgi:dihydrofolate reductase
MGGHDRPLPRRRGRRRRAESQAGKLLGWLLENQLVDEITLLTYPVVIGQGTRLFPATGPDTALQLLHSQSTPKGISIQVYRPSRRPQYATGE